MEGTHVPFELLPRLIHLLRRESAQPLRGNKRAGQGTPLLLFGGHQVGAAQLGQLDAVLQQAQFLVVERECLRVGAANVA